MDSLGERLSQWFERHMPDPLTLALFLTLVVGVLAAMFGNFPHLQADENVGFAVSAAWKSFLYDGALPGEPVNKGYLYFGFQMCAMLVSGHVLAEAPFFRALVNGAASLPGSGRSGVFLVCLVSCFFALIHWALGLILGALMARETGRSLERRRIPFRYPLLGAGGYMGLMIWGGGLSGSIPLKALEYRVPDSMAAGYPYGAAGIPLEETLFSVMNLVVACAMLLLIPAFMAWLHGTDGVQSHSRFRLSTEAKQSIPGDDGRSVASERVSGLKRLEASRLPGFFFGGMGLLLILIETLHGEFHLTLNGLNALFLFLGLFFHPSLLSFLESVQDGVKGCAGILVQFPFYFGIIGILLISGLGGQISGGIASVTTEATYPLLTFFSAGLVNLFVPSGGGQWLVQKDIVIEGALAFPGCLPKSILALAYGDGWTNMLQPFWALPLLAITGLQAREIVGYTFAGMVFGGLIFTAMLLVF